MAAVTRQKQHVKQEIYGLVKSHLGTLDDGHLRQWALGLTSIHMQKMSLKELGAWHKKLATME